MVEIVEEPKAQPPRPAELKRLLGRTSVLWNDLKALSSREYAPLSEEWTRPGRKYAWSLRLKVRSRTLCYLLPRDRHFIVAVVLGERAVEAARRSSLSSSILEAIDAAHPYVEGRGVRLEVRTREDLAQAQALCAIKMAN